MEKKKSFTVTTRSAAETVIVGTAEDKAPDTGKGKKTKDQPAASVTGQEGGEIEDHH